MNPVGAGRQPQQSVGHASAVRALLRAVICIVVFGGLFVAFLITPLLLVVVVCGGLWWAEWARMRRKRSARRRGSP